MDKSEFFGRLYIVEKAKLNQMNLHAEHILPAIQIRVEQIICNRCGQKTAKKRGTLPNKQYFCPKCKILGRISTLNVLYTIPEPNKFTQNFNPLSWDGKLSLLQSQAAKELKHVVESKSSHLLWAVTGAGKTEMLFNALEYAILKKMRICIASPRVDVCNELFPRLKTSFKQVDILLLHGKQKQKYRYTQIVICTTHQLLNFHQAFDVLIIDEVDSFPFVNNRMLNHAVKVSRKKESALIFLTATPTKKLLADVRKKKLTFSYLPVRYHGHILPFPKVSIVRGWESKLRKQKLPHKMAKIIMKWSKANFPFLIFVPKISLLEKVYKTVRKYLVSDTRGTTVYANDPERIEKVTKLRKGELDFLITTTILERGVTFPNLNVLVLGAENKVFTKSSLVQIAGRVGRSSSRPFGDVFFLCQTSTRAVKGALREISFLNRKGRQLLK
ncbi:DEAD/DEAH box helicase [Liquorilactobacillus uvarum]|uniref:Comf operon protein a, dna transporter atpase n=1 Tax=Liquorilactobacillus uvarum DSM 19971 TaxID=1423812 RepID=A0A0R1QCU7_9LACO|nr:DEAD/DEAH box helicase [Liquorilactobacillus uvarum]KRL38891.1 comf operon protein a, dna transporter atpase [Liquorilactobacillus uvarum DSM 19971]